MPPENGSGSAASTAMVQIRGVYNPTTNLLPPLYDSDDEDEFPVGGSVCSDLQSMSSQYSQSKPKSVLRSGKYSTYRPNQLNETSSAASVYSAPPAHSSEDASLMLEEEDELTELISVGTSYTNMSSASASSNPSLVRKRHRRHGHRRPYVQHQIQQLQQPPQQGIYYSPSRSTEFVPPTPPLINTFIPTRLKSPQEYLSPPKSSPRVFPLEHQVIPGGSILTRCSMRSLVFKTWHESYWVRYGPSKILLFRSRRDFIEWMKINSAVKNLDPASPSPPFVESAVQNEQNVSSTALVKSRKRRGFKRSRTRRKEADLVRKVIDFDTVGVLERAEREFAEKQAKKQEEKYGVDAESVLSSGTSASTSSMRHSIGMRVFRYGLLQMKFKKYPLNDAGRSYRVRLATLYNFKLVHWTDAGHGIAVAFGSKQLHELHSLRNSIIDCMDYCAKENKTRRKKSKKSKKKNKNKAKKGSKKEKKKQSSAASLPARMGQQGKTVKVNFSNSVGQASLYGDSTDGNSSLSSFSTLGSENMTPHETMSLPSGSLSEHQLKLPQYQGVGGFYQAGVYQYTKAGVPPAPESVISGVSTISNVSSHRVGFDGVRKK